TAAGYALRLTQAGFLIDLSAIYRQVLLAGLRAANKIPDTALRRLAELKHCLRRRALTCSS
ncbi:hypothetical protein, partial [Chromobacterium haemolyticum]|uniref:hypothetical protein n=1 Tax=Chromobacterium haemolyticum TaxID=394935 RepID=UPI001AD8100F